MGTENRHFIACYQDVVQRGPHRIAVQQGAVRHTHLALWNYALRILGLLQKRKLSKGDRVGLYLHKSVDFIASMLACWMGGYVFVPLDPTLPHKRLRFYRIDAELSLVLYQDVVPKGDFEKASVCDAEDRGAISALCVSDPAYLLYSSGSTGKPKGVLVSHRGLVLVLEQQCRVLELSSVDRILWLLSIQFDASISDVGVSLLSGATIIIDEQEDICFLLHKHKITYVDIPPSLLSVYEPDMFPESLTRMLIGGEVCPVAALDLHRMYRRICIVYGPTEATICTSMLVCDEQHGCVEGSIGVPLDGVEYRVVAGELWISGDVLALGYWNRPDLQYKWVIRHGVRYFRTGDQVEKTPDGSFLFVGRIDRQIKWRGRLVAPEEIEMVLSGHPKVSRAYVIYERGDLFAFVESSSGIVYEQVLNTLKSNIPDWMIPTKGMVISKFPCTPSGKIDGVVLRSHIAVSETEAVSSHEWCAMFSQVLSKRVHQGDHFFELGGDSIALLSLLVLARKKGYSLTPEILQENPTPDTLQNVFIQDAEGMRISDLEKEVNAVQNRFIPQEEVILPVVEEVFLTGATGTLGGKILALLCARNITVRVLVRAPDVKAGRERIPQKYRESVEVVVGDICDAASVEKFLKGRSGILFHCAADISQVRSYEQLYPVNVLATARLCTYPNIKVVYASTLATVLSSDLPRGDILEESLNVFSTGVVFGGYAQSKWVAEKLAERAGAVVARLGLVVDSERSSPRDWLSWFVRGLIFLKKFPVKELHDVAIDWTPLSYAGERFVALGFTKNVAGIYHLASPQSVSISRLVHCLQSLGYPIQDCLVSEFQEALDQHKDNSYVDVVALACQYRLTKVRSFRQYDMFLSTGCTFDDFRVRQQFTSVCPSPTEKDIVDVLRQILEDGCPSDL